MSDFPLIISAKLSFDPLTKDAKLHLVNAQSMGRFQSFTLGGLRNGLLYFNVVNSFGRTEIRSDEIGSGPSGPYHYEVHPNFLGVRYFNLILTEWKRGDILKPKFYWPLNKEEKKC